MSLSGILFVVCTVRVCVLGASILFQSVCWLLQYIEAILMVHCIIVAALRMMILEYKLSLSALGGSNKRYQI
jgi:hypothetical protein